MDVEIAVSNPTPDTEKALSNFSYVHVGSSAGSMRRSHDLANDLCTITCACGLAISFPEYDIATRAIAYASIDHRVHELPARSFTSSQARAVRVVGKPAA